MLIINVAFLTAMNPACPTYLATGFELVYFIRDVPFPELVSTSVLLSAMLYPLEGSLLH